MPPIIPQRQCIQFTVCVKVVGWYGCIDFTVCNTVYILFDGCDGMVASLGTPIMHLSYYYMHCMKFYSRYTCMVASVPPGRAAAGACVDESLGGEVCARYTEKCQFRNEKCQFRTHEIQGCVRYSLCTVPIAFLPPRQAFAYTIPLPVR